MNFKFNYSLLNHNSFSIDVKAKKFIEVKSTEELKEVLSISDDENKLIIGEGSNILFTKNNIEVLFLIDPVDDFWVTSTNEYQKKEFQSINRSDIDLEKISDNGEDKKSDEKSEDVQKDFEGLINYIKSVLGDKIKDVKISKKLNSSPVCLAVDGMGMDIRMERFLKSLIPSNKNHHTKL